MRILVVEDDPLVAQVIGRLMVSQSYAPDLVATARQGLVMIDSFSYDLVILDLQLPEMDGVSLCQRLRHEGKTMPILLVTGTNTPEQKAVALNSGADDYVVKPFDNQEFIARVLALLRRSKQMTLPHLTWGALYLDPACRQVYYGLQLLTLTPKEYALLELLLRHGEQVFSAQAILDQVWTAHELPMEETVRTHIKGLRQKLKAAGAASDFIETVHRVGYRLNPAMRHWRPDVPAPQPDFPNVYAVLGKKTSQRPDVLLVGQNDADLAQLQSYLPADQIQVVGLTQPHHLWTMLQTTCPDIVFLGAAPDPNLNLALCRDLRSHPQWRQLPVIVTLPSPSIHWVYEVFAAGANDVVMEPIVGPELLARLVAQAELAKIPRDWRPLDLGTSGAFQDEPA
jgi:DNA-binding response OmpR family regulator